MHEVKSVKRSVSGLSPGLDRLLSSKIVDALISTLANQIKIDRSSDRQFLAPATQPSCLHCGSDPGLSAWQKLLLRPGRSAPCRSCGGRVSVGRWAGALAGALTGLVPILLAVLGLALVDRALGSWAQPIAAFIGLGLGALIQVWLYHLLVPLVADAT